MALNLSGNIKVNLPQPGETKAQFMTRSVRLLIKSGKSKDISVGIAERIWNNTAQSTSIQSNDVDANVTFAGTPARRPAGPLRGSVAVKQMGSFNEFSDKLNASKMNAAGMSNNNAQAEFLNSLKTMLKDNLIYPMTSLVKNSGGNYLNNSRNYSNSGQLTNDMSGMLSQQIRIQNQTLNAINSLIGAQHSILEELTTIRSTGMKIRKTVKGSGKKPRFSDYWENYQGPDTQLGSPVIETFMKHMEGEMPTLDKAMKLIRTVANPIQSLRKFAGTKIRAGITKVRELAGDLEYQFQNDPVGMKRAAGLNVLDSDRLLDKVNTEIIPQKLADLSDDNQEQLDVLRNIYDVSKSHYQFVSGKEHGYKQTVDLRKTKFDTETGRYFAEDEYEQQVNYRMSALNRFWRKAKQQRALDPISRTYDNLISPFLKRTGESLFGYKGVLDENEQNDLTRKLYYGDSDEIHHQLTQALEKSSAVMAQNEYGAAMQFGPAKFNITKDSYGTPTGFNKQTIADWARQNDTWDIIRQFGDHAYRRGSLDTDYISSLKNTKQIGDKNYLLDENDKAKYLLDDNGNPIYEVDKNRNKKYELDLKNRVKYRTNAAGERQFRYLKDLTERDVNGELAFELNHNKFLPHQLTYDKYDQFGNVIEKDAYMKKRTMNPLTIGKEFIKEGKRFLSPISRLINDNIHEDSPWLLRTLKRITPDIKSNADVLTKQFGSVSKHIKDYSSTRQPGSNWRVPFQTSDSKSTPKTSTVLDVKILNFSELEDLKQFVINDEDTPLFVKVIEHEEKDDKKKKEPQKKRSLASLSHIRKLVKKAPRYHEGGEVKPNEATNKLKSIFNLKSNEVLNVAKKGEVVLPPKTESKSKNTNVTDELEREKLIREQRQRDKVQEESRDYIKKIYDVIKNWNGVGSSKVEENKDKKKGGLFSALSSLWDGLKTIASILGGGWLLKHVKNFIKHPIESIKNLFKWGKELPGKSMDKLRGAGKWFKELPGRLLDKGKSVVDAGKSSIKTAMSIPRKIRANAKDFMGELKRGVKLGSNGADLNAAGGFKQKLGWGLGKAKDVIENPMKNIKTLVGGITAAATGLFDNIGQKVKGLGSVFEGFGQKALEVGEHVKSSAKSLIEGFGKGIDNIKNFGKSLLDKGGSAIDLVKNKAKDLAEGAGDLWNKAKGGASSLWNDAGSWIAKNTKKIKYIPKLFAKSAAKSGSKKVPLLSSAAGAAYAIDRELDGDHIGAALELTSGTAGNVPVVGSGVSLAADVGLFGWDLYRLFNGDLPIEGEEGLRPTEIRQPINNETRRAVNVNDAPKFHKGGLIQSTSKTPIMQQSLGLKSDEVPIIAKEGEYVLNKEDTKDYLTNSDEYLENMSDVPSQIYKKLKEFKDEFDDFYNDFYGLNFTFFKPLTKLFIEPLDKWNGYYEFWKSLLYDKSAHIAANPAGTSNGGIVDSAIQTITDGAAGIGNAVGDAWTHIKQSAGTIVNKTKNIFSGDDTPITTSTTSKEKSSSPSINTNRSESGKSCPANDPSCKSSPQTGGPTGSRDEVIQNYVNQALSKVGSKYSRSKLRTSPGIYDCSSLVGRSLKDAGFSNSIPATGSMINEYTQMGFEWIPMRTKAGADPRLEYGDILLTPGKHTEIYLGKGKTVAAQSGESSGKPGVKVSNNWSSYSGVLRLKRDFNGNQEQEESAEGVAGLPTENGNAESAVEANSPSSPGKIEDIANQAKSESEKTNAETTSLPSNNIEDLNANLKRADADAEKHKTEMANQSETKSEYSPNDNKVNIPTNSQANAPRLPQSVPIGQSIDGGLTPPMIAQARTARGQQEDMRTIDHFTHNLIGKIFDNTIINFQHGSSSFALGNNPMSTAHFA